MSNEVKMTLEERIVQQIKSDTVMSLVGDEDAITELVKRAIQEALFQPRRVPNSYSRESVDSPVVATARDVAVKVATKTAESMVKTILEDKATKEAILDGLLKNLPLALAKMMTEGMQLEIDRRAFVVSDELRQRLVNMNPNLQT